MLKYMRNISTRWLNSGLRYIWLSLIILAVDCSSKFVAQNMLIPGERVQLLPFLDLVITYNSGAAFSILNTGSWWPNVLFTVFALIVIAVLIGSLLKNPPGYSCTNIALSFILGGALGNLLDRIIYFHVLDFIAFYCGNWHFPIFNIADVFISIGAMVLVFDLFSKGGR